MKIIHIKWNTGNGRRAHLAEKEAMNAVQYAQETKRLKYEYWEEYDRI